MDKHAPSHRGDAHFIKDFLSKLRDEETLWEAALRPELAGISLSTPQVTKSLSHEAKAPKPPQK